MSQAVVDRAENAVAFLKEKIKGVPAAAVVLGSGVSVLEGLVDSESFPFLDVFGISPSVHGHSGTVTVGRLSEAADAPLIAVFRGRFHLYEGHDWSVVTLAARVVALWGVKKLLLTNAAGGLNKDYHVGDLMVLTGYRDHLSPEYKEKGLLPAIEKPITKCSNALSDELLKVGEQLAKEDSEFRPLRQGTYCALTGPNYETMAEIEMLRRLKGDAVGMSTVPEMLAVQGTGTTSAAVSVITNVWREDEPMGGHDEVLEASKLASKRLDQLFRKVLS
ncbi:MAG TPA: purine-nucleoside phosphorylase [Candidatus Melainabacteria bacterium]|nr:purine-nucleoside phosphorylase [Candidatus Melainabacteria bacterium]